VKVVNAETELLEMVRTLHPPCRLTGCLYRRQEQGNQNTDDGDDDKKFDERETALFGLTPAAMTFYPPPLQFPCQQK
jgi:hypothetical protein